EAQERAGKNRHRDHEPLLRRRKSKVLGDLDAQRSEHHPDHETHVEVEERCKKCVQVTNGKEPLPHSKNSPVAPSARASNWHASSSQGRNTLLFDRLAARSQGLS